MKAKFFWYKQLTPDDKFEPTETEKRIINVK